ncbi:MAG TPA: peptidase S8, partial [Alteromonas sp.]|nr:peptidase S8 [Alteromonas sp.]
SQTVTLTVLPAGLMDVTYSNNTPVSIPDNDSAGVTSTITVADPYTVFGTEVSVDITHTWIGDLIVELTSPTGTTVNLHNRSGSSDDDIVATYSVDSFNGEMMNGDWVLSISDNAGQDLGTLNSWSLSFRALGEVTNAPPVAGFEVSTDELTATFSDTSTDPDDDIVSWDWSFGDGGSSSAMNPVYTYAAEGTYSVSLTVTDSEGQSDTYSDTVTVSEPAAVVIIADIRRSVLRPNGTLVSLLTWRPTPAPTVDIIRNGVVVATVANTGRYRDVARNVTDTEFTYQICDDRGCSDEMTVSF